MPPRVRAALDAAAALCAQYGISSLDDFLESCRAFAQERILNIAVLGRFKAGKSSFLNHLLGRPVLPVGVIPVTSVVTEIEWGPEERAQVFYQDGRAEAVPLAGISSFVSESLNPENRKQVERVRVELPSMERYRGIRFVDTPGLESVFEHNTGASLEWLPNVGLALVAVGADPPLSQRDIELIRTLNRYTPNISLLLTKTDTLTPAEHAQVREFVRQQLARFWDGGVPIYSYSIRPGFEALRDELDAGLLAQVRGSAGEQRQAILLHKIDSLLSECEGYLNVALKAAEAADSERLALRERILGQKEALDDSRLALRLAVRHAMSQTRTSYEELLSHDEIACRKRLQEELAARFPAWTRSLQDATAQFDEWMRARLTAEMGELSRRHRAGFVTPVRRVSRQLSQHLQDFRNRLSERVLEALGVPLRTTEVELQPEEPKSPDVRVGKIFDRNWELLSWLIPMPLIRGLLFRHFRRKVEDLVFANLSRLAAQWEAAVNASLKLLEKESLRRLDGLIATIETLIASAGQQAPRIREDLARIAELRRGLNGGAQD